MADWKVNRSVADLPIKEFDSWDADATEGAWREWAGRGKDPNEWGDEEWRRYKQRFVVYDASDPHKFESYKLPVAQISDGRPVINSKALVAAYQALRGARGGVKIPGEVRDEAESLVQRLRAKVEGKEKERLRKVIRAYLLKAILEGLEEED